MRRSRGSAAGRCGLPVPPAAGGPSAPSCALCSHRVRFWSTAAETTWLDVSTDAQTYTTLEASGVAGAGRARRAAGGGTMAQRGGWVGGWVGGGGGGGPLHNGGSARCGPCTSLLETRHRQLSTTFAQYALPCCPSCAVIRLLHPASRGGLARQPDTSECMLHAALVLSQAMPNRLAGWSGRCMQPAPNSAADQNFAASCKPRWVKQLLPPSVSADALHPAAPPGHQSHCLP